VKQASDDASDGGLSAVKDTWVQLYATAGLRLLPTDTQVPPLARWHVRFYACLAFCLGKASRAAWQSARIDWTGPGGTGRDDMMTCATGQDALLEAVRDTLASSPFIFQRYALVAVCTTSWRGTACTRTVSGCPCARHPLTRVPQGVGGDRIGGQRGGGRVGERQLHPRRRHRRQPVRHRRHHRPRRRLRPGMPVHSLRRQARHPILGCPALLRATAETRARCTLGGSGRCSLPRRLAQRVGARVAARAAVTRARCRLRGVAGVHADRRARDRHPHARQI
jgi:hypothetical protein